MAISPRAVGAWAYAASGSVTPTLPTHVAGDMLFVRVAFKSSAIATCAASVATAGWTKLGEFHNGTTNSGNGVGSVGVAHFWKIATSAAETNPTVAFSQAVTQVGHSAVTFQKGTDEAWLDPVGDGGGFASSTSASATIQSHVSVISGDMVVFFIASCDDTAFTVPTITQTGVTFAAVTEYPATAGLDATGADGSYDAGYRLATAGTSSAAAVVTATLAAAETGSAWMTRLRVAAGTKIYPTTTSSTVATASLDQVAWTTRSSGVASSYVDTVAGPTAPIQSGTASGGAGDDWFTTTLTAFSLTDPVIVEVRARESHTNNNAQVLAELARVDGDGTNPSVWATTSANVELTDSEAAYRLVLTGSSLAISNGQRLRIRFYFDDAPSLNMAAAGAGARVVYGATSAGAAGDTYVVFSQTLTEFSAGETGDAVTATGTGAAYNLTAKIEPNAGAASGTGAAHNAAASVGGAKLRVYDIEVSIPAAVATAADAELAAGTGAASNVSASVKATAGAAAGTGTASGALGSDQASAIIATGTGSASAASAHIKPTAGAATGTGLANNVTALIASNASAGAATGTGAAANPATSVAPTAGTGTGSGLANDATVSTASMTNAAAVTATGSGAAGDVDASVKPTAGRAAGTGLANNATAATTKSVAAGLATGTGAATNASGSVKPTAGRAAGTGTASGALGSDQASAIRATGTGAAHNATASVLAFKDADAGAANGTGAALDTDIAIKVNAGAAAGTGLANNAVALVPGATVASAGVATGSGTAYNAVADTGAVVPIRRPLPSRRLRRDALAVDAWSAYAEGSAHDATVRTFSEVETASGTGTAHDATIAWNDDETAMLVLLGDLRIAA